MTVEEWRPIRGSKFHEVSSDGRVRSTRTGKLMSVKPGNRIYPMTTLRIFGRYRPWLVHRLVADAFLGPCPQGHEVNHKDGDKLNASADNLEYVTRAMNMEHSVVTGLRSRAKLRPEDVALIRSEHRLGNSRELAERFGVSREHIVRIVHGRSWAHRAPETEAVDLPRNRRGTEQPDAKLNEEAVRDIRARWVYGNGKHLAREYGVSAAVVSAVVTGKTWKHVA